MLELISIVRADSKKLQQNAGLMDKFNSWVLERLDNWLLVITSSIACISILGAASPEQAHAKAETRIMLALAQVSGS